MTLNKIEQLFSDSNTEINYCEITKYIANLQVYVENTRIYARSPLEVANFDDNGAIIKLGSFLGIKNNLDDFQWSFIGDISSTMLPTTELSEYNTSKIFLQLVENINDISIFLVYKFNSTSNELERFTSDSFVVVSNVKDNFFTVNFPFTSTSTGSETDVSINYLSDNYNSTLTFAANHTVSHINGIIQKFNVDDESSFILTGFGKNGSVSNIVAEYLSTITQYNLSTYSFSTYPYCLKNSNNDTVSNQNDTSFKNLKVRNFVLYYDLRICLDIINSGKSYKTPTDNFRRSYFINPESQVSLLTRLTNNATEMSKITNTHIDLNKDLNMYTTQVKILNNISPMFENTSLLNFNNLTYRTAINNIKGVQIIKFNSAVSNTGLPTDNFSDESIQTMALHYFVTETQNNILVNPRSVSENYLYNIYKETGLCNILRSF